MGSVSNHAVASDLFVLFPFSSSHHPAVLVIFLGMFASSLAGTITYTNIYDQDIHI